MSKHDELIERLRRIQKEQIALHRPLLAQHIGDAADAIEALAKREPVAWMFEIEWKPGHIESRISRKHPNEVSLFKNGTVRNVRPLYP